LYALNKTKALLSYPKTDQWLWHLAQFHAGPDNIIGMPHCAEPDLYHRALLWKTLRHLTAGRRSEADEMLGKIPPVQSPHFWWQDRAGPEVLLTTVTRGVLGARNLMLTELATIEKQHRHTDWQKIWHDACFLLGHMNAEQYKSQPCQADIAPRLALVSALDKDIKGSMTEAAEDYRALLDSREVALLSVPELRQFIEWRLETAVGSPRRSRSGVSIS
jgi:hypothetical protein